MDSLETIKVTLGLIRELLDTTIDGADDETLARVLPGSTIGSCGAIYAHAVSSEDWSIQEKLQGKPQVFVEGGWARRLNVPMSEHGQDWDAWKFDASSFKQYTAAVRAATDAYLATLKESDLDRDIDWFGGRKEKLGWVIADTILMHVPEHAGEISALRGVMGQKGLPY